MNFYMSILIKKQKLLLMKLLKNLKINQKGHASRQAGFTLIELLVVIGILAVLLAITLIAINPGKQFSQANNTKRRSDVNAILNAVNQYMVDNKGALPAGITGTAQSIKTGGADICSALVPQYIAALPSDPLAVNKGVSVTDCAVVGGYDTEYSIVQIAPNSRITVSASAHKELGEEVSVTR